MNSERAAKIISLVFSPFITATLAWAVVIATYADSIGDFVQWFGLLLLTAVGVPSLYILHGVLKGSITDLHIKVRSQRFIPLALAVLSSFVLTFLYQRLNAPHEVVVMAAAMAAVGAIFLVVTLYWKISFHVAVFTSSLLIMCVVISWAWLWGFVFLPAIIWARLKRRRHDIWQALAAMVVGAVTTLGMMYWLL